MTRNFELTGAGMPETLAYYVALQKAGVPTEMHLYAQGGHAFGLGVSFNQGCQFLAILLEAGGYLDRL